MGAAGVRSHLSLKQPPSVLPRFSCSTLSLRIARSSLQALGYHAQVVEEEGATEVQAGGTTWTLGLALPGVTVPWGHAAYLWVATAASLAFHEAGHLLRIAQTDAHAACTSSWQGTCSIFSLALAGTSRGSVGSLPEEAARPACGMQAGHAIAAAAEGVGVHHMALFLVLLLPGAYVALDTETLAVLSPLRELRARPCSPPTL